MVVDKIKAKHFSGFTIVELAVVIVVIGILATITTISYSGVRQKATAATIKFDLTSNSALLKLYQIRNNLFPSALDLNNCPIDPVVDTQYCLLVSPNTTLSYVGGEQAFLLTTTTSEGITYYISEGGEIGQGKVIIPLSCPSNFIIVPGSVTYGTSDFCVMKYEAKNNGSNVAISTPGGLPWVSVTRDAATSYAQTVAGCSTCHLITEAEWMTIAKNVLSVPSNWRDNIVGTASNASNYIYNGHNDAAENSCAQGSCPLLAASSDDGLGYFGTGNFSGDTSGVYGVEGNRQRRTLTLSNGEVIWDLAGNAWEWTAGTVTGYQPGRTVDVGFWWNQWKTLNTNLTILDPSPFPVDTGIALAANWDSWAGIGELRSYYNNTDARAFLRSGACDSAQDSGVLTIDMSNVSSTSFVSFGFRVASN